MRSSALATAMLLTALGGVAAAAEMRVQAPVVDVEPVRAPAREVQHCSDKPADDAALGAFLAWDLGLDCRTERLESAAVTGYRVFYRWDDRVYSRVMSHAPGATVPLRIRLD